MSNDHSRPSEKDECLDHLARSEQLARFARRPNYRFDEPGHSLHKFVELIVEQCADDDGEGQRLALQAERLGAELTRILTTYERRDGSEFGKVLHLISLFMAVREARPMPSPLVMPGSASDASTFAYCV